MIHSQNVKIGYPKILINFHHLIDSQTLNRHDHKESISVSSFHFKQFVVTQESAAMKVGTDGVLLGAWVSLRGDERSALDVGTGTGLIALMLAQRTDRKSVV